MNNPFELFESWYRQASYLDQYNAMSLATANKDSIPSVRIVLLKHHSKKGFTFYTNINSKKGSDLANNPYAEILFFWKELKKQIRITGKVEQASNDQSDIYFSSRTRNSQITTLISKQSKVIPDGQNLKTEHKKMEQDLLKIEEIPRPDFWLGFTLIPNKFEFWKEGQHRLHTRNQYKLVQDVWNMSIIYP